MKSAKSRIFSVVLIALLLLLAAMVSPAQVEQHPNQAKFTTLFNFDGGAKGGNPAGSLTQGRDGNLYGTTYDGGANSNCFGSTCGTFFRMSRNGTITTLYNFCSQASCADGGNPSGPLVLATDGNFYGITETGGATGSGTAFKITPGGKLTTLYNWCSQGVCNDGAFGSFAETATFVQATDGNFYGTNDVGGSGLSGTAFKMTPSGTLTTLYTFCPSQTNCPDGIYPTGLIQGTDGNFYGTTQFGGANRFGTVFKMTPKGALTTLYNFCSKTNCADGAVSFGPLIQTANGNFYGTTQFGGANCVSTSGCGTAFKITTKGVLTTLYNFCSSTNCADGVSPSFSLVQAPDGNFYGSTVGAPGSSSGITLFRLTPTNKLTTLNTFTTVSQSPEALFQATNGTFYGVTLEGGTNQCANLSCGIAFKLATGLGSFVETVPAVGKVGSKVEILGQALKGTTAVSFNGKTANFKVVSDTYLTATVPSGATTGFVTVMTPKGNLKSNKKFRVIP